jgi:hypothetical protein
VFNFLLNLTWLFYSFSFTFLSDTPGTANVIIFLLCQYLQK